MSSELSSLYKNRPITLWVEDGLTRAWLRGLWSDADIGLLVAGGNDAVAGAVRDARGAGHANVFGVRDRDFLSTNRAAWLDPTKQPAVFLTEAHELENHLLDFDGLAALSPNHNRQRKTAAQLEARARQVAEGSIWWMATRATISEVRLAVTADFPPHPHIGSAEVATAAAATAALDHLLHRSGWGTQLRAFVPALTPAWTQSRLRVHEAALRAQLVDGSWRREWSGKELWRAVLGTMTNDRVTQAAEEDVAKALAAHQREANTVDPALTELRSAIRKRGGLDTW